MFCTLLWWISSLKAASVDYVFSWLETALLFVTRSPLKTRVVNEWERYLTLDERVQFANVERDLSALLSTKNFQEYQVRRAQFSTLRANLHSIAIQRMQDSVGADASRDTLWRLVSKFRLKAEAANGIPITALTDHFDAVFNDRLAPFYIPYRVSFSAPNVPELDNPFNMVELELALKKLDCNTAPGPSGITYRTVRELSADAYFRLFLLLLFNRCFEGGRVPNVWGEAEVFLLYKGRGGILDPDNYRGITLLDSFSKIYEHLLHARLYRWAEANSVLGVDQFGFRMFRSTVDAVFALSTVITKYVRLRRSRVYAGFIDLKKAFPSVNRQRLLEQLANIGVSYKMVSAIKSTFDCNFFRLRTATELSPSRSITKGVKEGGVLSPLLFIILFAAIFKSTLKPFAQPSQYKDPVLAGSPITGIAYADDVVILALSAEGLRTRLRRLEDFAKDCCLSVNVSKTEVVVFRPKRQMLPPNLTRFFYSGQAILVVSSFKYLGVWFHEFSDRQIPERALWQKFHAGLYATTSIMARLQASSLAVFRFLQTSLSFPQLYGLEFLRRPKFFEDLEKILLQNGRMYYSLPKTTSRNLQKLLFMKETMILYVLKRQFSILRRSVTAAQSSFTAAIRYDAEVLNPMGYGFLKEFRANWGPQSLSVSVFDLDKETFKIAMDAMFVGWKSSVWSGLQQGSSTTYLTAIFEDYSSLCSYFDFVSCTSQFAVRINVLFWCFNHSLLARGQYRHGAQCSLCDDPAEAWTARHTTGCTVLARRFECLFHSKIVAARVASDWRVLSDCVYQIYFHLKAFARPSPFSSEEVSLFECLL